MEGAAMMPPVIQDNLDYLLWGNLTNGEPGGLLLTLAISAAAGVLASLLGLAGGIALVMCGPGPRRALATLVALLRAIPVLMLIFWCYFLLPILFGVDIPGVLTVVLALALINAAYLSQSVQAGIAAIGPGQWAAGLSLGLDRWQTLRLIVLPQALRMMLPSFVNQWITLIKDSSLAYVVGVAEFTFVATQVNNREQVYPLEIFAFIALAYFVVCGGLQLLGRWSDRRWSLPARA
ncbi:amino acid ABC transporter permease [Chromobacterium haemolyticum]|uniref:amino acid ABC transporter permease n=1 Tax=Chromobacterium haemolyticum TaxID=394935 RepID=UPI001FCC84CB|nr:amino acid ABC transporter permease [Chromobacterium haemolyticum]